MRIIATENAPAAIGPYSQGYISGGQVFLSGQIPVVPSTGEVAAGGVEEQTEMVCKNIGELLKAAGSSFDKVIKTTCFIADMGDFSLFNGVYARYFTGKPARSCVAVKTLPKNCLCEIEVIAEE